MAYHEMCGWLPNLSLIKLPPYFPNPIPLNRYGAGFVSMCWLIAASKDYDDIPDACNIGLETLLPMWAGGHFVARLDKTDLMFNPIGIIPFLPFHFLPYPQNLFQDLFAR